MGQGLEGYAWLEIGPPRPRARGRGFRLRFRAHQRGAELPTPQDERRADVVFRASAAGLPCPIHQSPRLHDWIGDPSPRSALDPIQGPELDADTRRRTRVRRPRAWLSDELHWQSLIRAARLGEASDGVRERWLRLVAYPVGLRWATEPLAWTRGPLQSEPSDGSCRCVDLVDRQRRVQRSYRKARAGACFASAPGRVALSFEDLDQLFAV